MDEMQVDNGDITLRVEVTGDGPVVLCVHGAALDAFLDSLEA